MIKLNTSIDCKIIAEKIKDEVVAEVMKIQGRRPGLAIILIGDRPDSELYVKLKEQEAKKVGIDTHLYRCLEDISEREVFSMIDFLNKDDSVDAILVQLPLPDKFDTDGIILALDKNKDVDRFHPDNLKIFLQTCDHEPLMPPVCKVVVRILSEIGFDPKDKIAGVLSNSDLFGKVLAHALSCLGAKTSLIKSTDPDWVEKSRVCDLLASAVGKPHFIGKEAIKEGAVVVDIGIGKLDGKVCGDVDFEDAKDKAAYITPVPGGVGPLTIAMLFNNVLSIYGQRKRNYEQE